MKKLGIYAVIACVSFLAAFLIRVRHASTSVATASRPPTDAPDSVQLAALGVRPGAQLVAYVFGGSRCGFCQKQETKQAFAALRKVLADRHVASGSYQTVSVIGVAVNADLREGLGYLQSIGPDAFDQISTGSGWQNENVIRLMQQQHLSEPALPMVIVVSRYMTAMLAPLRMKYGADTVLKVVQGAQAIADWVRMGADLAARTSQRSSSEASGTPAIRLADPRPLQTEARR
jgi:hypothetical protein